MHDSAASRSPQRHEITGESDEIDLFALGSGLWHKKWLILGAIAAAVALALIYLSLTKPI